MLAGNGDFDIIVVGTHQFENESPGGSESEQTCTDRHYQCKRYKA